MSKQDKNYLKPFLIGVCGGTASGKTSLCKYLLNSKFFFTLSLTQFTRIIERLGVDCSYLALDSFYKGLT